MLLFFVPFATCTVEGREESKESAMGCLAFFVFMLVIGITVAVVVRFLPVELPYTAVLIVRFS